MAKQTTRRVTVLLSDDECARLDQFCRDRGFKKSTLIAWLVRQYLDIEGYGPARGTPAPRPARDGGSR